MDVLRDLDERLLHLEVEQAKAMADEVRGSGKPGKRGGSSSQNSATCCNGDCRPCGAWMGNRQMVMSLKATPRYAPEEAHFPCSPSCHSARLLEQAARERRARGITL